MNKLEFRKNLPSLISLVVVFVLFLIVSYTSRTYLEQKDQKAEMELSNQTLKNRVDILKNNKAITKESINEFNELLTQLIPEKEDFFSIIYALETISLQTGFTINGYEISIRPTKEKYALTVKGDGNAASFLKFLGNYNFSGGRLITNEKIEFTPAEVGKIKLQLNFYSKDIPKQGVTSGSITKKDLKSIQEIQSKITVNYKPAISENFDYAIKPDPFK